MLCLDNVGYVRMGIVVLRLEQVLVGEAEHFTSFPSLCGVITKMNAQACRASGGHMQY